MSSDMDIDISEVVARTTLNVKVTGVRRTVIRIKLMARLMQLAAWIGGFDGITFEIKRSDSSVNEQRHLH